METLRILIMLLLVRVISSFRRSDIQYGYRKLRSTRSVSMVKGNVGADFYPAVATGTLCGVTCHILRAPAPDRLTFRSYLVFDDMKENTSNDHVSEDAQSRAVKFSLEEDEVMQEEVEFGWKKERGKEFKMNIFIGGRIALRRGISVQLKERKRILQHVGPILSDALGAPVLPADVAGSISHKDDFAAAAVLVLEPHIMKSNCKAVHLGIDLERSSNRSADKLQRRLLSVAEQENLFIDPSVAVTCEDEELLVIRAPNTTEEDVMLRFSFKEALFKAINPILRRHIEFKEVEVYPASDGTALLVFQLRSGEQFNYTAEWRRFAGDYWLTCVKVSHPI